VPFVTDTLGGGGSFSDRTATGNEAQDSSRSPVKVMNEYGYPVTPHPPHIFTAGRLIKESGHVTSDVIKWCHL
jgi:hypothetical protein